MLTVSPQQAPDQFQDVLVSFEKGVPVSVDGKSLGSVALMHTLNAIGGRHGVGRVDICENRLVGMKSRGVYETPGGTILTEAFRGLEQLVYDRETLHYREKLALDFAKIIYNGTWYTPLREAIWAAFSTMSQVMTGDVVVRVYKGSAQTARRRSPHSLFSHSFATFGQDEVYDHADATGFIKLFALPSRIRALKAMDVVHATH